MFTVFRDSNPSLSAFPNEVSVNYTIPGHLSCGDCFGSKRLRRIRYSRANKQTARPERLGIVPYWLLSSCLISALSRSVRVPAFAETYN
jgi:hypothetical protein